MNEEQKYTLLKWRGRYKRAQIAHNNTATTYGKCHVRIGLVLILLTGILSYLTTVQLDNNIILAGISVFATILVSIQTFMNFSEQTEIHRVIARRYGELKKEIEYVLDFLPDTAVLPEKIDSIRKREYEIAQDSPNVIPRHWDSAKKETQEENDKYSVRNRN